VPAHDTVVLRVGGPRELALDQLFPAPAELDRALNYQTALTDAGAVVKCGDYGATRQTLAAIQTALRQGARPLDQAADDLSSLAASLPLPQVSTAAKSPAFWRQQLRTHTTRARQAILRAAALLRLPRKE